MKQLTESEKWVVHSHKTHLELEQLLKHINEAESGQQGFLVTRDSSFLHNYIAAPQKVQQSFERLKTLFSDNAQQKQNLDSLSALINTRFRLMARSVDSNSITEYYSDSLRRKFLRDNDQMSRIRMQTDKMLHIEAQLLKQREDNHDFELRISPLSFLLIAFFSLIIFIGAFFKIRNSIITLKKVNNQLMITHKSFEHAEQIAEIGNWYWNIEANTFTYSENYYRLLGCLPDEFLPNIDNFLKFVHPDDRQIILEGKFKLDKDKIPSIAYFRIIRKDGELRYFKSIGKIIKDSYGKQIVIGINADVTDQYFKDKTLEEKLFDLERSNNELSAFNHVASHDLQEPLRKVQTLISRIKEKDFQLLTEKGQEYFYKIENAARRMQKLIDDLILFSKTNKADKIFELTALDDVLENSKLELAQLIEDKRATIIASPLPKINAIHFQIQQLFNNLIGNSLKYSKANTPPEIKIMAKIVEAKEIPGNNNNPNKKFHKIIFSDNGIGFEQQYAHNIFNLFERLHDNKEYTGTGIGLTICKKIIENHKGYISAEGLPDLGSIFTIYLPA